MAIIKQLHTPNGVIEKELTIEEIEEAAAFGDGECRAYLYKTNEILQYLHGLTYEQLETYIMNNVTNLSEARQYLIKLSKVVLLITKFIRFIDE